MTVVTAANAGAAEISGVTLPPRVSYADNQLALAGCGKGEVSAFFIDVEIFVISLYLPTPSNDAATILAPGTTKLVQLDIVYDGSMPDSLPDDWRSRIEDAVDYRLCTG